jgi:broad specificity phosphatase PhoE
MITRIATMLILLALTPPCAVAQPTVLIVRHAERADAGPRGGMTSAADPDLSAAGRARALALAAALRDAAITAIFATEYRRTQQTAAPLAKALRLTVVTIPARDVQGLVAKVNAVPGNVLVVGHSNTIPDVIQSLGVESRVDIAESQYDNLFILTRGQKTALLRLHYR